MALEDFERELAQSRSEQSHRKRSRSPTENRHRHHRHRHHHTSKNDREERAEKDHDRHQHKRSRYREDQSTENQDLDAASVRQAELAPSTMSKTGTTRDSWMQAPSSLDIEYVQRKEKKPPPSQYVKATLKDQPPQISERDLTRQLRDQPAGNVDSTDFGDKDVISERQIDYTFGDAGSHWRMTRLKAVYKQAKEKGQSTEDAAIDRYGDLRDFDDAREEEIELERRDTYGKGYVGKDKPSGELFQERKLNHGVRRDEVRSDAESEDEFEAVQGKAVKQSPNPTTIAPLDQTSLNKLKAQIMKAKLKNTPDVAKLEADYNAAMSAAANGKQPDVVVLNKMEHRMLSARKGEVKQITTKRGQERGLVEENEDMSIDDMVRQEKRTKGQYDDAGRNFADRIAKDAKFVNDLEYMDDNAVKLSKNVQKSDINLRNTAIEDYKKTKHILDTCPLCHHEDTNTPPQAPLVSLAIRTFLTLPTSPEITPHGLCASIVPIQHRLNLLECDDDEWEEIRNFMKALSRFYYNVKPGHTVIFYENAAHDGRKRHASLEAVPLPLSLGDTAPAFFREAIMAADEEWTQHRKLIDTGAKARDGAGKLAFRRSMVSELPYFHVWFTLDGGFGHVVEDARRWPKGDLFAREIIGGMLDVGAEIVKRQGRWKKGDAEMDSRVKKFKKGWEKFDWTSVLMDAQ